MVSSPRQSNFELLRLVCMVMVMIAHANFGVSGETTQADILREPILSFWHIGVNQFVIASLNVFLMISGWFGINISKKGVCSLLFQVVFLSLLCAFLCLLAGWGVTAGGVFWPVFFGSGYWFVASYMILYVLSPVLNTFVEHSDRKTLRSVLILFFAAEMVFGWIYDSAYFIRGFSPCSFLGLYLLTRYIRLYPTRLEKWSAGSCLLAYVACSALSTVIFFFGLKYFNVGFHLIQYNSPLMIPASLFLFLTFAKIKISSPIVNWMATSAFAIYLIHENPLVRPHYRGLIQSVSEKYQAVSCVCISLGAILAIAFACILADQPRVWLWNKIKKSKFLS